MRDKFLYIPMELVVRELDGKALLAAVCASRGWNVFVGQKRALMARCKSLPQGVFLVKSATPNEFNQLKLIFDAGHRICVLDEEGLVDQVSSFESQLRYNSDTLSIVDKMLFWGEMQCNAFSKALPEFESKAVLTGSPRSDFWVDYARAVYGKAIKDHQRDFGDYIFVPSSFGGAAHRMGTEYGVGLTFEMAGKGISSHMTRLLQAQGELLRITFNEYYQFLPELAQQFPETSFVVRPHPSETHEMWKRLEQAHANIHVVYNGSVTSWILGSRAMLHFRSTTSVEGYLLGVPVLTYEPRVPEYLDIADLELPAAVSLRAENRREFTTLVLEAISTQEYRKKEGADEVLKPWIYSDCNGSASTRIEKVFSAIAPEPTRGLEGCKIEFKERIKRFLNGMLLLMNEHQVFRRVMPMSLRYRAIAEDYGRHKEMGLDISLVNRTVDEYVAGEGLPKGCVKTELFCEGVLRLECDERLL
ncbi:MULTISPECIES: surface carbohydrate biosynthesis protein [unclassified Thalassospira]|jgi:surface carbohydrate biosynthesis protein|uniref:surface carbohydrate biosynthesis protein n=1 Tax=unclassified Thalassospira TaxID=2648997 RepID=UPI0007A5DADC|nr:MULTISPECIES: surface carbohydrate biosynthesis protein [unclassified Thalassospira]KZC99070.1 hypothetical protein AUQ41_11115 [Thalassospira sp. MCCC 1A02898]ONH89358.1 hypothetical protein TH47_01480 [Thalassospira sp. MCCC 1A02803]